MLNLGFGEILFIGVLALLLIGPKQLPEVARTLGRFLNELKRSVNTLSDEFKNQASNQVIKLEEVEMKPPITDNKASSEEIKNKNEDIS